MEDEKMYSIICKEKFDELGEKIDALTDLLRGENGSVGLAEEVRRLKRVNKYIFGAALFIISTGIIQAAHWIFTKI